MKALFKMEADFGRQGELEGVFVADTDDVQYLIDYKTSIYFGEVLGKHSEIYGYLSESEIKEITRDEKIIDIIEKYELESGYNPFNYKVCVEYTYPLPKEIEDWENYTVYDYIHYMRFGKLPE